MTNIFSSVLSIVVTSADLPGLITRITDSGIFLLRVKQTDTISAEIQIYRRDYGHFKRVMDQKGEEYKCIARIGVCWKLFSLRRWPIPVLTGCIILVLTIFLSGRIFFVRVVGNETIPKQLILEKAEAAGVGFGSVRADIRSEKVKNTLLAEIPELQWIGVNTGGCVATIHVREKSVVVEREKQNVVSSIIASCDGVIKSTTVYSGNALCKPGQAVKQGDLLVSGYIDTDLHSKFCNAEAEIIAQTNRRIHIVTPMETTVRSDVIDFHKCFGLRIGKKLIKFCNHSGIYDASCGKMYLEESWTLPGGFELPIAWIQETVVTYDTQSVVSDNPEEYFWLHSTAESYLTSHMIAGMILSKNVTAETINGCFSISGNYSCEEIIGQESYEEILR